MRRVERKEEGRKGYCEKKMGESVQCGGTPYEHHTAATLRPPAVPPQLHCGHTAGYTTGHTRLW